MEVAPHHSAGLHSACALFSLLTHPRSCPFTQGLIFLVLTNETHTYLHTKGSCPSRAWRGRASIGHGRSPSSRPPFAPWVLFMYSWLGRGSHAASIGLPACKFPRAGMPLLTAGHLILVHALRLVSKPVNEPRLGRDIFVHHLKCLL